MSSGCPGTGRRGDSTISADEELLGASSLRRRRRLRNGDHENRIRTPFPSTAHGDAEHEEIRAAPTARRQAKRSHRLEGIGEEALFSLVYFNVVCELYEVSTIYDEQCLPFCDKESLTIVTT